jgi:hypothetical protein
LSRSCPRARREVEELEPALLDRLPDARPLHPVDAAMHGAASSQSRSWATWLSMSAIKGETTRSGHPSSPPELVAEALAAAGRHDGEEVPAFEQGQDDLRWPGRKALKPNTRSSVASSSPWSGRLVLAASRVGKAAPGQAAALRDISCRRPFPVKPAFGRLVPAGLGVNDPRRMRVGGAWPNDHCRRGRLAVGR